MNARRPIGSLALVAALVLTGCTPPPTPRPDVDVAAILRAIDAAGSNAASTLDVIPLINPGVAVLRQKARSAAITGDYARASAMLDQAAKLAPKSPQILQDQAELALRQQQWAQAGRLAYDAWQAGTQVGSLCAKNWQTILEVHRIEGDAAGAATAGKWRARCAVAPVHRY